jgi:sulfide:quinone oxidoreductase
MRLSYDGLIVAFGSRPGRGWHSRGVLTYHGRGDTPAYRLLLREIREGRVGKVAFVRPAGPSWLLPLYDLALTTAAQCQAFGRAPELTFVTPEAEPLEAFGEPVSSAVRELMDEAGIALHLRSHGVPSRPGRLHVQPGNRRFAVDRIVTLPRLVGPPPCGLPRTRDGFIETDAFGRVSGFDDVFAAGDATTFGVKQGGLAAQQADAVATTIASELDGGLSAVPFDPVLRGLLLTGGAARYLRAELGGDDRESVVSEEPLWWPPNRLCGRYLAPYLSSQVGFAADVMPEGGATSELQITQHVRDLACGGKEPGASRAN